MFAVETVDFRGAWDPVYASIKSALGTSLLTFLTVIGLALIVLAGGKWLYDKQKGGGGGQNGKILWTMVFAALLAAPGAIIPIGLKFVDAIINTLIGVLPA